MPKTSDMRESKFLKKEDVGRGMLATITGCIQKNVAKEGADPEHKWCLTFREIDKPLVLNSTNVQLCEAICGSDDTDDWIGKTIVLYTDPNVSYQGKLIGGIRVRAVKKTAAPPPPPPPIPPVADITDDDIPFAWIMPFVLPALAILGAGVLFA
jgi:hypothetical protein